MNRFKLSLSSLRVRLTLWYVFILAIILVLFALVLYNAIRLSQYRQLQTGLLATSGILVHKLESAGVSPLFVVKPEEMPLGNETYFQVINLQGQVQIRSRNLEQTPLPLHEAAQLAALRGQTYWEDVALAGGQRVRLLTVGYRRFGFGTIDGLLQVAVSSQRLEKSLSTLRFWLWVVIPLALALTSVGGIFLADRLLKPLSRIIDMAKHIGSRNLSRRLNVDNAHDELGQLATTLNALFERLETSFNNQQRFIADASHELRTPMAALRAEVEVALRRPRNSEEYVALLCSNLEEIKRLSHMAERLLFLTQSDAGELSLRRETVRLDTVCQRVHERFLPLAQERGVALRAPAVAPASVSGDAALLEQLVGILVDNALKYTPPAGQVSLACGVERARAWLEVQDTGPGIPREHLPHLFERFYRVDKARSRQVGGVGLGLSIAHSIVTAHEGELHVQSQPGQGTTFKVCFPALS